MDDWITKNYHKIIEWANNISKGDELSEELAHYSIEKLMTHPKYDELCQRDAAQPGYGHLRAFMLAIMRNSWIGSKSEFSRVCKSHRSDIGHRKRVLTDDHFTNILEEIKDIDYDYELDFLVEAVEGLIEEMELDYEGKLWYNARLLKMWLQTPNFSELSRKTDIPRTSISNAVEEAKSYILQELKIRKII